MNTFSTRWVGIDALQVQFAPIDGGEARKPLTISLSFDDKAETKIGFSSEDGRVTLVPLALVREKLVTTMLLSLDLLNHPENHTAKLTTFVVFDTLLDALDAERFVSAVMQVIQRSYDLRSIATQTFIKLDPGDIVWDCRLPQPEMVRVVDFGPRNATPLQVMVTVRTTAGTDETIPLYAIDMATGIMGVELYKLYS